VNFDILADYRPLTAGELASGKAKQGQKTATGAGKAAHGKAARRTGAAKKRGAQ
jgi:hypothetical protein